MNRAIRLSLAAGFCLVLTGRLAWGEASGLNNIPTTDVVPPKVLVLQSRANVADDQETLVLSGMKFGVIDGLEMGVDLKTAGDPHNHVVFEAKYAFDIDPDLWQAVVGIANVSGHRKDTGDPFPYVATSYDLKACRLHLGFSFQEHNEAIFAGIDKTVPFLGGGLQLKADAIQFNDMDDVLLAAGFLFDPKGAPGGATEPEPKNPVMNFLRNFVLESWVSVPTNGSDAVVSLKLNYVIRF